MLIRRPSNLTFFITFFAFLFAFLCVYFFASQTILYHQERAFLGTFVKIEICALRRERPWVLSVFEKAWTRLGEINERLNVYNNKSDVVMINRSYSNPVQVHSDTYQVLKISKKYNELTRGSFDITVRPLSILWKDAEKKNMIPSAGEIKVAQAATGNDKLKLLPDNFVQLLHPQAEIDVSAVGQGYAADECARILKEQGLQNFFVDVGGEIFAQGKGRNGCGWTVGINDPNQPGHVLEVLKIIDKGVSVSGSYEKYYTIGQKKYSRIIDPATGWPGAGSSSAVVVAENATLADILSTAFCVLGKEKAIEVAGALPSPVAFMIIEEQNRKALHIYRNPNYQDLSR